VLFAVVLTACAATPTPHASHKPVPHTQTATPTAPPAPPSAGTSATANAAQLAVYSEPDGAVTQTLDNPNAQGVPLTMLVVETSGAWLKVQLAQRPNGSTGWIKSGDVTLHSLAYNLTVSTADHTLQLFKDGSLVKTYTAATGTGGTPTPRGSFYITELLEPTNEGYGPYAFGLSAFSDVLSSFGGGPGQIGLHGTDDVDSIGRDASHGCIRLSNADITELAQILPLGTPITIE
jgi:lipoprotein-anchoring transpeptidase ErfK/SrfK